MSLAALDPEPVRLPVLAMPSTRAGCSSVPRPCPFERCRFHLAPEQNARVAPDAPSCSLDVSDLGGQTLDQVGNTLGLTRERIRQIERRAIARLAVHARKAGLISPEEAARLPEAVREVLNSNLIGRPVPARPISPPT